MTRVTILIQRDMVRVVSGLLTMLCAGLRELSIYFEIAHEVPPPERRGDKIVILGANQFPSDQLETLPETTIVFNVENSSSKFITPDYIRIMRRFKVWDYDKQNALALSEMLGATAYWFRVYYVEALSRIEVAPVEDIDVLFFGSFNERRSAVLDELRARGLSVNAVFGVYGADLDALIARAKVVINIHFYANGRLEIIRLLDLIANRRPVVTELNEGEFFDEDFQSVLVAAPYEKLVEVTVGLVNDPVRRFDIANRAFDVFKHRRADVFLREALAWSEKRSLPRNAIIGSGKMYDPGLFNIDINALWHPDIVADISDPHLFQRVFASRRFGELRLQRGCFDTINASHVIEHIPDLVGAMSNCLELLSHGGEFHIAVPYDLSYGAWQDPTHVHAFNERSWLYYCEWYWYLDWVEARFDLAEQKFIYSAWGNTLASRGVPADEILRTPRAVDEMHVVLRKRRLTEAEVEYGKAMRGDLRENMTAIE